MTTDLQARLENEAKYQPSGSAKNALDAAIAEITRLEKQSTRLNDDRNEIRRELQGVQIQAENAELRKVLAWYGDKRKYDFQNTYSMTSEINKDRGHRAREALSND